MTFLSKRTFLIKEKRLSRALNSKKDSIMLAVLKVENSQEAKSKE